MPSYFDFEVSLMGIEPRIWRRFLLMEKATFANLHEVIQAAFGWENDHLYEFRQKGRRGGRLCRADYEDPYGEDDAPGAKTIKVRDVFARQGDACLYVYDFGDDWHHEVALQGIVELPEKFSCRLLGGARNGPPEDCGGVWGYGDCCQALACTDRDLAKMTEEERENGESRREWLGDWRPEDFDLVAKKKRFDR